MSNGGSSLTNQDMTKLHGILIDFNRKLNKRLDKTTNIDDARRIVTEMREVVHRIDLVQSLLFTKAAKRVTAAVEDVNKANAKAVQSVATLKKIVDVVRTVTSFLTLVDDAIDLAKTLGI